LPDADVVAHRHDGGEIGQYGRDLQTGHVFGQVAPVRTDIKQGRTRAALARVHAPRIHRIVGQPVLQILAVHERQLAQVAPRDHRARVLHERIAAIVERHDVRNAVSSAASAAAGGIVWHPSPAACPPRHAAGAQGRHADVEMQVVRRRVVDDVDARIVDQLRQSPGAAGHAIRARARADDARPAIATTSTLPAAYGVDVVRRDEAWRPGPSGSSISRGFLDSL
jgi:hypothetical protein